MERAADGMTFIVRKRKGIKMIRTIGTTTFIGVGALALTAFLVSGGRATAAPPPQAPLTDVTISLSENPATEGDIVVVTAHATVRATGQDVPGQPGELVIQACLDANTLNTYVAAANCNSPTPTGIWEDLNLFNQTPPIVTFNWPTTGEAGDTIGLRGHYKPKGSGYAGRAGSAVDLVVNAKQTPPSPPPPVTQDIILPGRYHGGSSFPFRPNGVPEGTVQECTSLGGEVFMQGTFDYQITDTGLITGTLGLNAALSPAGPLVLSGQGTCQSGPGTGLCTVRVTRYTSNSIILELQGSEIVGGFCGELTLAGLRILKLYALDAFSIGLTFLGP
jgi:hypothetical protein